MAGTATSIGDIAFGATGRRALAPAGAGVGCGDLLHQRRGHGELARPHSGGAGEARAQQRRARHRAARRRGGRALAMPRAGHLIARYGSRPVTRVGAAIFGATLLLPALAPNAVALVLALVALGVGHGTLDVAMNAQASTVERAYGRPIMSELPRAVERRRPRRVGDWRRRRPPRSCAGDPSGHDGTRRGVAGGARHRRNASGVRGRGHG